MYLGLTQYCNYNIVIVMCHPILHSWTGLSVRVRMMFRLEFQYWKMQYNSHLPQYFIFITFSSFNIQCQYNNMLKTNFFISNTNPSTLGCNTCSWFYFHFKTCRKIQHKCLYFQFTMLAVFVLVFECICHCIHLFWLLYGQCWLTFLVL